MKKLLSSFLLFLVALSGFGQAEYFARLPMAGGFSELGVSPAGQVWIATRAGALYFTPQVGQLWDFASIQGPNKAALGLGETYERVTFFSENILMVSGFIQDQGAQNVVYWSDTHGATWRKVPFGPSSWLDACYATPSGKAWMSGSSQLIYYTEDSGRSWRPFHKVEASGNLRFSTIHFAPDEKMGLFGAFWNGLYRTPDNCRSWEKLPTPLSQHKYHRISKEPRPEIVKARIFGDHYILNQEGKVFLTRATPIDWQRLPDVLDFEASASGQLYTVHKDLTISLYDPQFRLLWQSTQRLDQAPRALAVRNEKLFAVTPESVYQIDPAHFAAAALLTNRVAIPEPYRRVRYHGTEYGFEEKDLLRYDQAKKQWARLLTAPFVIGQATVFNGRLLLSDHTLNRYYAVNDTLKTLRPTQLPASLWGAKTASIAEFHLEQGSQGCFHADNSRRSFRRKGARFELVKTETPSAFLSRMDRSVPASLIEALAKQLDDSRGQNVTFADLGITPATLEQFDAFLHKEAEHIKKKGVDPFDTDNLFRFPGEQTDFRFYQNTARTLAALPAHTLNEAFGQAYGHWSTTRTWSRIIFVFEDGKKLIVENGDDKPNYLDTPWTVDYDGVKCSSPSIRFGQRVDELTKGQFFAPAVRDKTYAIFGIVNYLYRQKLLAEE